MRARRRGLHGGAMRALPVLFLMLGAACASAAPRGAAPPTVFGGQRPVVLQVPVDYDGASARPLVLVLHGYTSNGIGQQRYFRLDTLVNTAGAFLLAPDGTQDARDNRFWNATDACCDLGGTGVDDVAYLRGLIADVRAAYRIDPARIYVLGHSNGGFMANRLACEAAGEIAAIVSLAGSVWQDPARCTPSEGVSVLSIHGNRDSTIRYEGGAIQNNAYPSAAETMGRWAAHNGCDAPVDVPERLDVDAAVEGAEAAVRRWTGCRGGLGVELWTLEGGGHVPRLHPAAMERAWAWLLAHPKAER